MARIEIRGLDVLVKRLGAGIEPALAAATLAIGEEIRDKIATYPGPAHSPVIWSSERQRRYYFARRRREGLDLRYIRQTDKWSQRLVQGWVVQRRGRFGAVVGNKATYAPWVQDADRQTRQHKASRWQTDKEAVGAVIKSGVVEKILEQAIRGVL
jgi:hypothetical protein